MGNITDFELLEKFELAAKKAGNCITNQKEKAEAEATIKYCKDLILERIMR